MPPQLSKTERQALLAQLAAKRRGRGVLDSLEDSDDDSSAALAADDTDEDDSFATARSRQPIVLDDSSEDENGGANRGGATSRPAPGDGLRRLHKAARPAPAPPRQRATQVISIDTSSEDKEYTFGSSGGGADDIAAQLGSLSIKNKPGRGSAGGGGAALPRRRDGEPPAPAAAAATSPSDSGCLVLSGRGEFKLKWVCCPALACPIHAGHLPVAARLLLCLVPARPLVTPVRDPCTLQRQGIHHAVPAPGGGPALAVVPALPAARRHPRRRHGPGCAPAACFQPNLRCSAARPHDLLCSTARRTLLVSQSTPLAGLPSPAVLLHPLRKPATGRAPTRPCAMQGRPFSAPRSWLA